MSAPVGTFELRRRAESCLSDLALERLSLDEVTDPAERTAAERHLASCHICRSRRGDLAAAAAELPDPAFWRQATRRRWGRPLLGGMVAAAGLAAVLALVVRPHQPDGRVTPSAELRTKGAGLTFEVVARRRDGRSLPVFDGTVLRPGDAIRFLVTTATGGSVAVMGLDSAGGVSIYAPASESTVASPVAPGKNALAGSVVLDDVLGEERFVALVCDAMPERAVLAAAGQRALAAAGGVPSRASRLDLPCRQDALTVRKEAER